MGVATQIVGSGLAPNGAQAQQREANESTCSDTTSAFPDARSSRCADGLHS